MTSGGTRQARAGGDGIARRAFIIRSSGTALALAVAGTAAAGCGSAAARPDPAASPDQLFQAGRFAQADAGYAAMLDRDPVNFRAVYQRGFIALLDNRLGQAEAWFGKALAIRPGDSGALAQLAYAQLRADDFGAAAATYGRLGQPGLQKQLESFKGRTPYDIAGPETASVPLLQITPHTNIDVGINGLGPVPMRLDTGGAAVWLLPEAARRAGLSAVGPGQEVLAYGQKATQQPGRPASLTLGTFEVSNVPASIFQAPSDTLGTTLDGRTVQGVVGSSVLFHFLSTIDYAGNALVLRRKTPGLLRQFEAQAARDGAVQMPFWIYTDHIVITMGTVNGHGPMPLTVDTDATAPFLTSQPIVRSAGIKVVKAVQASRTLGLSVSYDLIDVNEIALGRFTRRNVPGLSSSSGQGFPYPFANGGTITAYFLLGTAFTIDTQHMRLYADQISRWSPPAPHSRTQHTG